MFAVSLAKLKTFHIGGVSSYLIYKQVIVELDIPLVHSKAYFTVKFLKFFNTFFYQR